MAISDLKIYLPIRAREAIECANENEIQEIRIMAERNCALVINGKTVDTNVFVSKSELSKIVEAMSRGSLYAMQHSLSNGFFTVRGGHRVGVCGRVTAENGKITHMSEISSLCIRVSKEIKGASDVIMPHIENGDKIYNTLLVSPPGAGKTTVLRDIARNLGNRKKVCVVDERSEIADCRGGVPGNDIGKFTTVLDGAPKAEGMRILLRTMAPDVIITDETGSEMEEEAIEGVINCGVKLITTAHGYSERDVLKKKYLGALIENGVFERIVVLSSRKGPGTVEKIIKDGQVISYA
ncbi:MAG: stage III sporulation protein AA [Clostridia bacterium]|nr:stage III sporulation protein AA [Clostridia bacterium]